MKAMTNVNLKDAFAGESQAHMRYLVYATLAEREGLPNIARMFRAASFSEQIHATNHLRGLEGSPKTVENVKTALDGETFEIAEMYPAYLAVAGLQDEKRAQRSMGDALEAEKVHAALYARAHQAASAGSDVVLTTVFVCPMCGYTVEGEAPEKCPLCGTPKSKFAEF